MRYAGTALTDYFGGPDFTGLGQTMMESASLQRNAANVADATVSMAGIGSQAKIKGAGYQADALRAQGAAQGQASMWSGIGTGISGLAGGITTLGKRNNTPKYTFDPYGSQGNPLGLGGRMPLNAG